MKKMLALGLVGLSMAAVTAAEQTPPTPPQAPAPAARPDMRPDARGLMRSDTRHQEVRAFAFHTDGPGGPMDSARILPPGAWWKDSELAKRIELTPDLQKKIEDLFLQNKIALIHTHANLEEQELLLGPLLEANPIDQGKALAQISKIADTRADLEKANAKMLLQVRGVLSQAQWTKLQQERPGGMRHIMIRTPDGGGPHSFNFVMPDMDKLHAQLKAMPPIDVEKMKEQIREGFKDMQVGPIEPVAPLAPVTP